MILMVLDNLIISFTGTHLYCYPNTKLFALYTGCQSTAHYGQNVSRGSYQISAEIIKEHVSLIDTQISNNVCTRLLGVS
jgi:hypothetical protein